MPSFAQPMGNIPEKSAPQDVKVPSTPSFEEEPVLQADSPTQETEVDESDLKALEEHKKVPYNRFKEKVDETNALKEQIRELSKRAEEDKRRLIEEAELRLRASSKPTETEETFTDPYEKEIRQTQKELSSLKSQLASLNKQATEQTLKSDIERLKGKFPEADDVAVLGWSKVIRDQGKEVNLEELMERSHNRQIERDEQRLKTIIEHKKAKAKQAVPTKEGGIRLKDSERPKTVKEANALLRKWIG